MEAECHNARGLMMVQVCRPDHEAIENGEEAGLPKEKVHI